MPNYQSINDIPRHVLELNPELRPSPKTDKKLDILGDPFTYRYEHDLQVAVFDWVDNNRGNIPELSMMFAIPNGGHRHKSVAAKMKREGAKAGYPDIALDVARSGYHGLRIELKVGRNKPTASQRDWLARLDAQGYKTAVCADLDSVVELVIDYLRP